MSIRTFQQVDLPFGRWSIVFGFRFDWCVGVHTTCPGDWEALYVVSVQDSYTGESLALSETQEQALVDHINADRQDRYRDAIVSCAEEPIVEPRPVCNRSTWLEP